MWRRMAEDRQIGGWSHHSHRLQLRVLCLSMRHKWSAARLSAAIGGGPHYEYLAASLSLLPSPSLCMTMSMTNHGQHVKNLSWNIWAVNLAAASRRRNTVPLLVDFVFLKLVHKYCYKCVESKQLETNERSTGFPYLLVYLWHDLKWVAYNLWIIWKTRAPLESLTLNRMPNQITWVHKYNWNMLLFGLCRTYDNISIGQHDKNK